MPPIFQVALKKSLEYLQLRLKFIQFKLFHIHEREKICSRALPFVNTTLVYNNTKL